MSKTTKATGNRAGFAGVGAVRQSSGSLPIYICNECGADVVWAESKRTGRKYLVTVSVGYKGQRFYVGANVHSDDLTSPGTKTYWEVLEEDGREATAEGFVGTFVPVWAYSMRQRGVSQEDIDAYAERLAARVARGELTEEEIR